MRDRWQEGQVARLAYLVRTTEFGLAQIYILVIDVYLPWSHLGSLRPIQPQSDSNTFTQCHSSPLRSSQSHSNLLRLSEVNADSCRLYRFHESCLVAFRFTHTQLIPVSRIQLHSTSLKSSQSPTVALKLTRIRSFRLKHRCMHQTTSRLAGSVLAL